MLLSFFCVHLFAHLSATERQQKQQQRQQEALWAWKYKFEPYDTDKTPAEKLNARVCARVWVWGLKENNSNNNCNNNSNETNKHTKQ